MAAAAIVRNARCHACRHDLLQSFARISGLTIAQSLRPPNQLQTRRFFAAPNLRIEPSNFNSEEDVSNEVAQNVAALNDSTKSQQSVPWYLQVEPATEAIHPAARQREIPAVPENAPPITQDMLQHLADEIGLDDLVLLDLRGRDPPPALGASLIMIIGSARSLKHLNVSADRFCRWLRSTYKLRPYADGLLGRNELKIKLRRKARRARLASSSGTIADSSDDGITTGWICVNVGSVDDPNATKSIREGGFEGFGKVQGGTRIVVQMFTEEKRADVDLEKLWAPKRDTKDQSNEASNESIVTEEHQVRPDPDITTQHDSNQPIPNILRPPPQLAINQKRTFSTSSARYRSALNDEGQSLPRHVNDIPFYLRRFSTEQIIEQLGNGPDDKNSTEFLRNSYRSIQSESDHFNLPLILAAAGVSALHPEYTKEYLWGLFLEHTGSGYKLDYDLGLDIADALLVIRSEGPEGKTIDPALIHFDIESALRVMDHISLGGVNLDQQQRAFNVVYKTHMLDLLIEDPESVKKKALRTREVMNNLDFDWNSDISRETMQLRLMVGDVDGFYEIWHAIAFNEMSRTAEDYKMLFNLHAMVGNPAYARECLAGWIPMMGRETPPIEPEPSLISAIAECAYVGGYSGSDLGLSEVSDVWREAHPRVVEEIESLEQSA